MKKLAIFDLDGTLLNTIADLAHCTNYTLAFFGLPTRPESDYHKFVGNGISKLIERALPPQEQTAERVAQLREVYVPYYNTHNRDYTTPYPGIVALLTKLQAYGIKLAIASNKYQAGTEQLAAFYFPNIQFDVILGQRDNIPPKPDPYIINEILAATGISKEQTIYIGDSAIDMQTTQQAHVEAIGVSWGFRPLEELLVYNPKYTVTSAEEIEHIILQIEHINLSK